MTRIAAIAFDLDGTLVDSAGGIAHALNTALAESKLRAFDLDTVRAWIGGGPDALIARSLQIVDPDHCASSELARRLRRTFDAETLRAPMAGSRVYDGISDVLHSLAERLPMVVVTNKPTSLARAVLSEAGLLAHFKAIHGADLPAQRKPSPVLLWQAAADLGVASDSLLMVGDAESDLGAACAAACRAAWVEWGYGRSSTRVLEQLSARLPSPLWRLSTPDALLARLSASASADAEPGLGASVMPTSRLPQRSPRPRGQ